MSRRVITTQLQASTGTRVDSYFDKLVKYIPTDIVGAWIAIIGLVKSADDIPQNALLWGLFVFFVLLTGLWTLRQTSEPKKPPARIQTLISTGAFIVWGFALGEPFSSLSWYHPVYGSIALIMYSLIVPLINPSESSKP